MNNHVLMIFSDRQMWLRSPTRRWLSADVQPDLVLVCRWVTRVFFSVIFSKYFFPVGMAGSPHTPRC